MAIHVMTTLVRLLWRPRYHFAKSISSMEEKEQLRTCNYCGGTFPLSQFRAHKHGPQGHARMCLSCNTRLEKEWRVRMAKRILCFFDASPCFHLPKNERSRKILNLPSSLKTSSLLLSKIDAPLVINPLPGKTRLLTAQPRSKRQFSNS